MEVPKWTSPAPGSGRLVAGIQPHTGRISFGHQSYAGENSTRTRLETARRWKLHQRKHTRICTTAASLYPVAGQELTAVPNRDVAYSQCWKCGSDGWSETLEMEEASALPRRRAFHHQKLARRSSLPPKPMLHTPPKRMHNKLDRGSTARCSSMVCCQGPSIAWCTAVPHEQSQDVKT